MKRKIEDYINKGDYAVLCSSIEEWNAIVDLINKNHVSTTTQPYSKTRANVLNLQNLGVTIGTGTLKSFPSYIIYSASDFLEEEFKFEEGKWYYIELGVHKHYLKFKKINKNNAFLDKEGYIKNLKEWDYGCSINIKEVTFYRLLTDLSEIQEFLPDGHVDKIKTEIIPEYVKLLPNFDNNNTDRIFYTKGAIPKMENWSYRSWKHLFEIHSTYFKESTKEAFDLQNKPKQLTVNDLIKGEIYVFDISSIKNFISKFNYIDSYSYYDSCFIQNDAFCNDPKSVNISGISNIRLATIEEKKWLNVCISQDKFIPKEDLHLYDDNGLLIWEIGCYYKLNFTDSTSTYIKLSKKIDDRIFGNEYTDSTGKWYYSEIIWSTKQLKTHEKVDKPNQKKETMFKKNDYIVVLYNDNSLNSWTNQCFKQLEDLYYLKVVKNLNGNTDGWSVINFENQSKWRYASSAEILEYERIGKPFDVTTLIKKEKSLVKQVQEGLKLKDRWVKCIKQCGWKTINVGEYIQILENNSLVPYVEWKNNKEKYYIDLGRIDKAEFELMPEGFSPNEKEWIPKVGDWVFGTILGSNDYNKCQHPVRIIEIKEDRFRYDLLSNPKTDYSNNKSCFYYLSTIVRKASEKEIAMHLGSIIHNQYPLTPIESFQLSIYDLKDIHIPSITKKTKKLQTITIESTTNLNLNLRTIKSKQIQTIKI